MSLKGSLRNFRSNSKQIKRNEKPGTIRYIPMEICRWHFANAMSQVQVRISRQHYIHKLANLLYI